VSDYQEVKQLHHEIKKLADEIERLRLTDEEREAIRKALIVMRIHEDDDEDVLEALLERTK
jgi:hypothetical protein